MITASERKLHCKSSVLQQSLYTGESTGQNFPRSDLSSVDLTDDKLRSRAVSGRPTGFGGLAGMLHEARKLARASSPHSQNQTQTHVGS